MTYIENDRRDCDASEHSGARELADRYPNVHFLENEALNVSDVKFLGGTMWTDFRLRGHDTALAMVYAECRMNDFKRIKFSS